MAYSLNHTLILVFGVIGNLLSLLVFLAPIPTFVKIWRTKTSRGYKSLPYNLSFFSCLLWAYYAKASKSAFLLLLINFVGCAIEGVYIIIFVIYGSKKSRTMTTQVFVGMNVMLFSQIVLVSHYMFSDAKRVALIGWICVAFNISTYAAPMSAIGLVIRTKNVQYMPFGLSFWLTLNATAWTCYGVLTKNIFIMIPTIAGFFFGVAQMAIYIIYKKKGAAAAAAEAEAAAAPGNAEVAVEADPAAAESPDIIEESNRPESSDSSRSMRLTASTTGVAEASSVAGKIKGRIKKAKNSLRRNGGAPDHPPSPPAAAPKRVGGRVVDLAPATAWDRYHSRGKRVIEVGESSGSSTAAPAKETTTVPDRITRIAEHIAQISEHIVKIAEMTPAPSPPELQAITEESESESTDAYRLPPPAPSVPEHVINIAELTSSLELGMAQTPA